MIRTLSLLLALVATLALAGVAAAQSPAAEPDLVVCPTCEVNSLADALATAAPGAVIEVRGGTYAGPLVITQDVTLIGVDRPIIENDDNGTVIHATGAFLTMQGFLVRGSGTSLDREHTGILVDKGRAVLLDNRIEDSLFGIYLKESPNSELRNNVVTGKDLPEPLKGDSVRIWYCDNTIVDGNVASDGRDTILWYSNHTRVTNNTFDRGRYGLHLMFSDDAHIEGNSLNENSIGLYIMYSRNAMVVGNSMSNNRGPSGGGLGLKDVDNAIIESNRFVGNQIAAQIDTSPREPGIENYMTNNVFAFNEVGIAFQPAVRHNTLTSNSFIDNHNNVTILGGGELKDITWAVDGRGNYWSDYAGYDSNGDGVGDIPYASQRLFESLLDKHPQLRMFIFSPAAMAIDFAARAMPAFKPQVRFEDPAPLMSPPPMAGLPTVERASSGARAAWGLLGVGSSLVTAGAIWRMRKREGNAMAEQEEPPTPTRLTTTDVGALGIEGLSDAAIAMRNVTKLYGKVAAVDDFTLAIPSGQSVALWGPNGAGKTTILRCLLGVARYTGDIRVHGTDPAKDGRKARHAIGYVPQDLAPSAMTVSEMMKFIAKLKDVDPAECVQRLELLGIADAADKAVDALSGGMKQRLALALALLGSPKTLFLDEPTANLDAAGRAELLHLLRDLKQQGMTIVFSSHRPDDVLTLADRIVFITKGVLIDDLTPGEFADRLDSNQRLTIVLRNGHREEAVNLLKERGYTPTTAGEHVLSLDLQPQQKGEVLMLLAGHGVAIDDFDLERA